MSFIVALPRVHAFAQANAGTRRVNQRRRERFDYRTIGNVPVTMLPLCHSPGVPILAHPRISILLVFPS